MIYNLHTRLYEKSAHTKVSTHCQTQLYSAFILCQIQLCSAVHTQSPPWTCLDPLSPWVGKEPLHRFSLMEDVALARSAGRRIQLGVLLAGDFWTLRGVCDRHLSRMPGDTPGSPCSQDLHRKTVKAFKFLFQEHSFETFKKTNVTSEASNDHLPKQCLLPACCKPQATPVGFTRLSVGRWHERPGHVFLCKLQWPTRDSYIILAKRVHVVHDVDGGHA